MRGHDHHETLNSAAQLANLLIALGDLRAARELADDTLARSRRILGGNHPITLIAASNVGILLFNSGNRIGARKLLEQTLAGCRQTLGDDHPATQRTKRSLDQIAAALGGKPKTDRKGSNKKRRR